MSRKDIELHLYLTPLFPASQHIPCDLCEGIRRSPQRCRSVQNNPFCSSVPPVCGISVSISVDGERLRKDTPRKNRVRTFRSSSPMSLIRRGQQPPAVAGERAVGSG